MNVVRSHVIIVVTTTCQMNNIYATWEVSPLTWTLTNSFFMTLSAHRQIVNTGLTLLWPIAFAMNLKITLSQLRLHVKTVVLDVLYVTSSMTNWTGNCFVFLFGGSIFSRLVADLLQMDFSQKKVMLWDLIQPLTLVWNLAQGFKTSVMRENEGILASYSGTTNLGMSQWYLCSTHPNVQVIRSRD